MMKAIIVLACIVSTVHAACSTPLNCTVCDIKKMEPTKQQVNRIRNVLIAETKARNLLCEKNLTVPFNGHPYEVSEPDEDCSFESTCNSSQTDFFGAAIFDDDDKMIDFKSVKFNQTNGNYNFEQDFKSQCNMTAKGYTSKGIRIQFGVCFSCVIDGAAYDDDYDSML